MTTKGAVPFTEAEELARDAEESAWLAAKSIVDHNAPLLAQIVALESPSGFTRRQREWLLAKSGDLTLKENLSTIDLAVQAKRALLRV